MGAKAKEQSEAILAYLERHANQWVSVYDLIRAARTLSHTKRISELKARGYDIQNECRGRERHSFYRYTPKAEQLRLIA